MNQYLAVSVEETVVEERLEDVGVVQVNLGFCVQFVEVGLECGD